MGVTGHPMLKPEPEVPARDRAFEYRGRAAELRRVVEDISGEETRRTLLEIAERYDRLARKLAAELPCNGAKVA